MMVIEALLVAIRRPRVAPTLGDPAEIGPELAAKFVPDLENVRKADIFILADKGEVEAASFAAGGVKLPIAEIAGENGVQIMDEGPRASKPVIPPAQISKEAGECSKHRWRRALDKVLEGQADAILVFAPLNES
ncbi:hypothetical protein F4809DRAFT_373407 [Biscogniauxia mediterranea]|nr:hypothetical protein F4809DRAFT_373407 [Biscogniauxia mediterranea]